MIPNGQAARLEAVLEGRLLGGPETLQVNLANACNLNCIFCWNHSPLKPSRSASWERQKLSHEHLASVMAALPQLRPGRVQLSGRGEPLLHPEIRRFLEALQRASIPTTIQTNGIAGPSPDELADLGVDHLVVNISAGTSDGYERSHPGRRHTFDEVTQRLARLAAIRAQGRAPRVTLVAVIQRTNRSELSPIVELAARVGASGVELKGMELEAGLEPLMIEPNDRDDTLDLLDDATHRAERLGVAVRAHHLRQILQRQTSGGSFTQSLRFGPCYMGWYYLRVTCDGRVMFCCKDKLMDHLDRRSLYEIWRSPAYHLHRLAGRDGDTSTGLFDAKCAACSNFTRNREVHEKVVSASSSSEPSDTNSESRQARVRD